MQANWVSMPQPSYMEFPADENSNSGPPRGKTPALETTAAASGNMPPLSHAKAKKPAKPSEPKCPFYERCKINYNLQERLANEASIAMRQCENGYDKILSNRIRSHKQNAQTWRNQAKTKCHDGDSPLHKPKPTQFRLISPEPNDGFEPPPKRLISRPNTPPMTSPVPTENSFSDLESVSCNFSESSRANSVMDTSHETIQETPKKGPLPIMVNLQANFSEQCAKIQSYADKMVNFQVRGSRLKITPENEADYLAILCQFEENSIGHSRVNGNENQLFKVVLKGLPTNADPQNIAEEIKSLGFDIREVARLKSIKGKKPLPIFMLKITKNSHSSKIFDLSKCLGLTIKIQKFRKSNRTLQCYRCQGFSHHSSNCHFPVRCVKCLDNHPQGQCPKPDESTPPACVNCGPGSTHAANWRGCPKFPKSRQPPARKIAKSQEPQNSFPRSSGNPWRGPVNHASYDQQFPALGGPTTTQNFPAEELFKIIADLLKKVSDLTDKVNALTELKSSN